MTEEEMVEDDRAIEYLKLICTVSKLDKTAACYMKEEAVKLKSFQYNSALSSAFDWSKTPQGFEYWNNVDKRIKKD